MLPTNRKSHIQEGDYNPRCTKSTLKVCVANSKDKPQLKLEEYKNKMPRRK